MWNKIYFMVSCGDIDRLVWIGCDSEEAARDWLWLSETRTMTLCFCSHMFSIKWRHPVSCGHSPNRRKLDSAAISNCKLLGGKMQSDGITVLLSFISLFSFLFLHSTSSLTSTTRRSSAALRVCRNTEPETEVNAQPHRVWVN